MSWEIIAVSHIKVCMAMDATPGSPQYRCRPPGPGAAAMPAATQSGGPATTKWVSFSDPLYLHHCSRSSQEYTGNRFSPTLWGGFCTHTAGRSFAAFTDTLSTTPAETVYKDRPRPLFSQGQCSGGSPVEAASAPGSSTATVPCTPALLYSVYSPCI
jgi:hypothetical protein